MTTHDQPIEEKSKTQRKHEAQDIKDLGRRLTELDEKTLGELPLPDRVRDAVNETRRITQHGARRRQLQYLAKILRGVDTTAIDTVLEREKLNARESARKHQQLEVIRDRLLAEGDSALSALIEDYPQIDRAHVRRLLRDARKQQETDKPPAAARALFQYLRDL